MARFLWLVKKIVIMLKNELQDLNCNNSIYTVHRMVMGLESAAEGSFEEVSLFSQSTMG